MALQRRYSSVGPALSHRRIQIQDFDAIKLIESEVLCHSGAQERKMQLWMMLEVKLHEFARTGPPEEMGQLYDKNQLADSEIKSKTVRLCRRYQELVQLYKYLKKHLPQMEAVNGKKARHANIPKPPNRICEKIKGKGLVKSATHWPGSMSKSAETHIGEENTKYQKYVVQHPTERDIKHWFVSICQLPGVQDLEGFQHFLKDDSFREEEHLVNHVCCTIS